MEPLCSVGRPDIIVDEKHSTWLAPHWGSYQASRWSHGSDQSENRFQSGFSAQSVLDSLTCVHVCESIRFVYTVKDPQRSSRFRTESAVDGGAAPMLKLIIDNFDWFQPSRLVALHVRPYGRPASTVFNFFAAGMAYSLLRARCGSSIRSSMGQDKSCELWVGWAPNFWTLWTTLRPLIDSSALMLGTNPSLKLS